MLLNDKIKKNKKNTITIKKNMFTSVATMITHTF